MYATKSKSKIQSLQALAQDRSTKAQSLEREFKSLYLPSLADALKKLGIPHATSAAILISQIYYWMTIPSVGHILDGEKWIYNTYDAWLEQIPSLSKPKFGRMFRALCSEGLIEKSCYAHLKNKFKHKPPEAWHEDNRTTWVKPNHQAIADLVGKNLFNQKNLKPAPSTMIHGCILDDTPVNHATFTSESSIYKEFQEKTKQQHVVAECEFEEEKSSERGGELTPVSDLAAEVSREVSPANKDLDEGKSSAPAATTILNEVKALGLPLNPQIRKIALEASVEVVRDAIAHTKERVAKGEVRDVPAYFRTAVLQELKPTSSPSVAASVFTQWYNQAYKAKLVTAATLLEGIQMVCLRNGDRWITWEQAKLIFPNV